MGVGPYMVEVDVTYIAEPCVTLSEFFQVLPPFFFLKSVLTLQVKIFIRLDAMRQRAESWPPSPGRFISDQPTLKVTYPHIRSGTVNL